MPAPDEERSYLLFLAAALLFALGAGLVLGLLVPAAPALGWRVDPEILVQAHGWTQLDGWLGLVVAGMALRMMPRLAHRRPLPAAVPAAVLVLIGVGTALRLGGQLSSGGGVGPALLLGGSGLVAAGLGCVAAALAWTLARGAGGAQGWRVAALAGSGWWAVWGALTVLSGVQAAVDGGLVPSRLDQISVWAVLLGAVGNVIWAVQARSVPVFFGRRSSRLTTGLVVVCNLGAILIAISAAVPSLPLEQTGLALAGGAVVGLAATAGSIRGRPHRLRAPSRAAASFILLANRWAVLGGACLLLGSAGAAAGLAPAAVRLDQAALHALGLGLATTLIVGMARLVAPVFAIARATPEEGTGPLSVIWWALLGAGLLRVGAALAEGLVPTATYGLALGLSGVLAWLALALFAASLARGWARQSNRKARLANRAKR